MPARDCGSAMANRPPTREDTPQARRSPTAGTSIDSSRDVFPERSAQIRFHDLAGAALREIVAADFTRLRSLGVSDPLAAKRDDLVGGQRTAGLRHDDRVH